MFDEFPGKAERACTGGPMSVCAVAYNIAEARSTLGLMRSVDRLRRRKGPFRS